MQPLHHKVMPATPGPQLAMIGIKVSGTSAATETVIGMAAETAIETENEESAAEIVIGIATEIGLDGIEMARAPLMMTQGAPRAKVAALMVV